MNNTEIQSILQSMGERVPPSSRLTLLGGSALTLLGSPRVTIDIDFVGDDIHPNKLHQSIIQIAKELKIHVEAVPIERFIPLPKGSEERSIRIGQFGNLEVYVADPYSIALSKLDRGVEIDFEDIIFLIRRNFITMDELERITRDALLHARKFDLHPEILSHLQELKSRL
ncbi:MAG: hypothetical protein KJ606_06310 [Chloroflexi bacterium]|nr:hypothetical protein [Chloroflexota bacterium]